MNAVPAHMILALSLPVTPGQWYPIAIIAVLLVIFAAAIVYMLSGVINSGRAKAWARFQVYEALLSLLLIIIFISITYIFFINPQPVMQKLNLVPGTPGSSSISGCTAATDLYSLATCDVSEFNNASFTIARYSFYWNYAFTAVSGIIPEYKAKLPYGGTLGGTGINITFEPPGLVPDLSGGFFNYLWAFISDILLLNQVQVIMLASSLFFLGFFVSLGLIARTFGFSRTFGGAMIAFGIGIGIIYPLLAAITYGYIDVAMSSSCIVAPLLMPHLSACSTSNFITGISSLVIQSVNLVIGSALTGPLGNPTGPTGYTGALYIATALSQFSADLGHLFITIGYVIAGLTIIPLLNLLIVDTFIIDFSSAIGERMSFQMLFMKLL